MNEKVSVIGLGKLGLCLAAVFASKAIDTLGIDIEERVVDMINNGTSPISEPGLEELISSTAGKKLRASLSHRQAIEETDISFILMATPSNQDGTLSLKYVNAALQSLSEALKESGKPYHLFVIGSTVLPGSASDQFIPLVEEYSGRKLNEGFGLVYDPEFVALGEVIQGFLNPEVIIIGESNRKDGDAVQRIHETICRSKPHVARMSITSAEIAKITLNTYITVKISFANLLSNICENVPGADIDAITSAVGQDRRISPFYFQAGPAYGGPCFPRDTRAFIAMARHYGSEADLIHEVEKINERQHRHLLDLVLREADQLHDKTIGLLGLSFKQNTPVVTESVGIRLITELLKYDLRLVGYDRLAIEPAKALFNEEIEYVSSPQECITLSSLCIITVRSPEFKSAFENLNLEKPVIVIDCWRLLDAAKLSPLVRYIPLGHSAL